MYVFLKKSELWETFLGPYQRLQQHLTIKKEKSLGLEAPGNTGPLILCKIPHPDVHKQLWKMLWKIGLPYLT